jgi:hypothetical protein
MKAKQLMKMFELWIKLHPDLKVGTRLNYHRICSEYCKLSRFCNSSLQKKISRKYFINPPTGIDMSEWCIAFLDCEMEPLIAKIKEYDKKHPSEKSTEY